MLSLVESTSLSLILALTSFNKNLTASLNAPDTLEHTVQEAIFYKERLILEQPTTKLLFQKKKKNKIKKKKNE